MKRDDYLIAEAWEDNISRSYELSVLDNTIETVLTKLKTKNINLNNEDIYPKIAEIVNRLLPKNLQNMYTTDIIIQRIPHITYKVDENLGPLGATGTQPGGGAILTMRKLGKRKKNKKSK